MTGAAESTALREAPVPDIDPYAIDVLRDPCAFHEALREAGKIANAIPYLESLTRSAPANAAGLYNFGIACSEIGQFDEAIIRLKRAVQLEPGHAHARVGIGDACHRLRKPALALEAFEPVARANPDDSCTQRSLGGMLTEFKRIDAALVHLRNALALAGGFRPDVMMYIAAALKTFNEHGPKKRQAIALEIAVLGRTGLDINDPEDKYPLRELPGMFSGLHLLASMYTAFKQIDPTMDRGAEFSAEYQAAVPHPAGRKNALHRGVDT